MPGRLFHPAYRADFRFGALTLRPNMRAREIAAALRETGWRVLIVWECSLKGPGRRPLADVVDSCVAFIRSEAGGLGRRLAGLKRPTDCVAGYT